MNLAVYIINVVVCISIIIFCGTKVMIDPRPETTSIYLPIMSAIGGYFIPNPTLRKKEENKMIVPQVQPQPIYNTSSQSSSGGTPISPPLSPTLNIDSPRI